METSNLIKVAAAFVGGVVVALGSALIYVRATEMMHARSPIESTALVQQAPSPPSEPVTDEEAAAQNDETAADKTAKDETPATPAARPAKPGATVHAPAAHATAAHPKARTLIASVHQPTRTDPTRQDRASKVEAAEIGQSQSSQNQPAPALPAPAAVDSNPAASIPLPDADARYGSVGTAQPSYAPAPQQAPAPAPQSQPQYNAPAAEPLPQPHVVTLPSGTNVNVRLIETLSTDHNYTGDTFRGTLESPIIMDGFIIADRGSKVLGRIVSAQKAGRVDGQADLMLTVTEINTTDGQRVRIETTSFDKKGQSSMGEDAAKIAGGAAIGAIIGAAAGGGKGAAIGAGAGGAVGTGAVLVTHGKPAVLASETRLNFRLTSAVTITEKLNY